MRHEKFWSVIGEILKSGEFIAAAANSVSSANLVGTLHVGNDARETVVERPACGCHIHVNPQLIDTINFTGVDAGFGMEPCCEFKSQDETVLRLYFRGSWKSAAKCFQGFSFRDEGFVSGEWRDDSG